MGKFLVTGLINLETTVKVASFPIEYIPIEYTFNGINSEVSGGGMNICKALTRLGDDVELFSLIGSDGVGDNVRKNLKEMGIKDKNVLSKLKNTPQSVVLYGDKGKRQIYADIKEIQEVSHDEKLFLKEFKNCDILVLSNVNFSRPFLKLGRAGGKLIASHVHGLKSVDDEFNKEFMEYSDILFLSNENIEGDVEDFVKEIAEKYHNQIIVVGLGAKGAVLYDKKEGFIGRFPAVKTREIISTIGAGDSLFSAFLHFYTKTNNPFYSIKNAILFASYKIGTESSAHGFLTEEQLEQYYPIIWRERL